MACNNPLCPECKACHTDHVCKHCKVPVCSICCFQRGLEGEYICINCCSSKSTSQSGDTNNAATAASTSPTPVTAAASALPSPPFDPQSGDTNVFTSPASTSPTPVTAAASATPPTDPPPDQTKATSSKKRNSGSGPTPTSRASTASSKKVQIGKGVRVKSQRQQLYHILTTEQKLKIPKDIGNTHNFYGTVVGGSSTKGWNVSYDVLPHGNKVVNNLNRTRLAVVNKGEEEKLYDRPPHQQKVIDGDLDSDDNGDDDDDDGNDDGSTCASTSKIKETASAKSTRLFIEQSDETIAASTSFTFDYLRQKQKNQ